ncbi:DUF6384 family protein [Prosthecomicrobium hirschii]|uniref:DUF6384 family protein n=1 Tax=Prosthecodimorpha hirschii TaxID=665126 RepID=UPI0022200FF3|nr:DUF6384 family protein [Prosthecomicrobium hirschii]MCW1843800.1 DUF6384 family protein [Prosthecomicrobium hirschii]
MSDASPAAAAAPPSLPAGTGPAPAPAQEAKLDDIMMAMDVVDTLRHQDALVARELDQEARESQLVERLREIYRGQGIEVTDRVLIDGVRSLAAARFVYTPPPPGLARSLALIWIDRGRILRQAGTVALVVALGWGAYSYFWVGASERAAEQARIEITQTLPGELDGAYQAVQAEARVAEARSRAGAIRTDGRSALERKDAAAARQAVVSMNTLLADLRREYSLRIVSRPGEQSGIWRVPRATGGRNYYLIVEALAPDGSVLKLPITSEEDQKTTVVDRFGIRVSPQVFEDVRRDKADDGIIQHAVIGQKTRGTLEPTWTVTVLGGTITSGW